MNRCAVCWIDDVQAVARDDERVHVKMLVERDEPSAAYDTLCLLCEIWAERLLPSVKIHGL